MSSKSKKIKWGILAPGHIATKFASDLATVKDAQLYAVASRSLDKAIAFKKAHQAKVAYGNYMDLINDPKVDAIYIATPHAFHKIYTIDCLRQKKAVLCEKPLALNSADVDQMIQTAREEDTLLMEALWTCFLPHYKEVLSFLSTGAYGEVLSVEADFGFAPEFDATSRLFDKQLGGGSLLDIGIYPIILALSVLGIPEHIEAKAQFFETGADSECRMKFHYKEGKTAQLYSTILEKTPTQGIIQCERGKIILHSSFHKPTSVTFIDDKGKETTKDFGVTTLGYSYEILHFNDLLRRGKTESPVASFEFSKNLIQTMDKVKEIIGLSYSE
ncbi:Gfo/Idh/MocA family protein [Galbibacter sp.]|jgi:predicted dehydrogenase|uniref:Gfo/Idh/MocA family protein n=1 Tax=Galbibacter sp. TaxID=2918471 RepID=UPI003A9189BC